MQSRTSVWAWHWIKEYQLNFVKCPYKYFIELARLRSSEPTCERLQLLQCLSHTHLCAFVRVQIILSVSIQSSQHMRVNVIDGVLAENAV